MDHIKFHLLKVIFNFKWIYSIIDLYCFLVKVFFILFQEEFSHIFFWQKEDWLLLIAEINLVDSKILSIQSFIFLGLNISKNFKGPWEHQRCIYWTYYLGDLVSSFLHLLIFSIIQSMNSGYSKSAILIGKGEFLG